MTNQSILDLFKTAASEAFISPAFRSVGPTPNDCPDFASVSMYLLCQAGLIALFIYWLSLWKIVQRLRVPLIAAGAGCFILQLILLACYPHHPALISKCALDFLVRIIASGSWKTLYTLERFPDIAEAARMLLCQVALLSIFVRGFFVLKRNRKLSGTLRVFAGACLIVLLGLLAYRIGKGTLKLMKNLDIISKFTDMPSGHSWPALIARRGCLKNAPRDTLAGFQACLESNIGFKLDVDKTKDNHLIATHEGSLDCITSGTCTVAEMSLKEIRKLNAGSWFYYLFGSESAPTVEEVFQLIAEYRYESFLIAVDLKSDTIGEDVVRLAEKYDVLHRLTFIGLTVSNPTLREALKHVHRHANTAVLANSPGDFDDGPTRPGTVYFSEFPSIEEAHRILRSARCCLVDTRADLDTLLEKIKASPRTMCIEILTEHAVELTNLLSLEK